ncbi:MAG: hypothetical protein H8E28_06015 [Anaerolineae bacterium]|nr:hypothetical protein [Anaerolineae bacterium]MBL6966388.1 hypothetical protein [Anaerolineales bacterium]
MLDDLRGQIGDSIFDDEEDILDSDEPKSVPAIFLGMTPVQRFVIAAMVMMIVCILSSFCLLVTERISLPVF